MWSKTGNIFSTDINHLSNPFTLDTYQTNTGFMKDEYSITFGANKGYKCMVLANRRMFIANIRMSDRQGNTVNYGDRIMYSPVNKFDTFPSYNYIDIGMNDGEEFNALAVFSDRLFAFKRDTLYIINIADVNDSGWYLEAKNRNMGVMYPYAVVTTDFGIAWVNQYGLFFFDGSEIRNLVEGKIDKDDWEGDISDTAMLGWHPRGRKLIVCLSSNTGTAGKDGYMFSFEGGFCELDGKFENSKKTQFFTDNVGNMWVGQYDDAGTADANVPPDVFER